MLRVDLHEHDFSWIVTAGDDRTYDIEILLAADAGRMPGELIRQTIGRGVRVAEGDLKRIERRKRLQFDQSRLDTAIVLADETEIDLHEEWHVALIGPSKTIRDHAFSLSGRVTRETLARELLAGRGQ